jgi:2-phosphosulfolactate phosphatase
MSIAVQSTVRVHLLPELAQPQFLAGHTVVVVDVLRATTTVAAALSAGASEVIPCLEVAEARNLASKRQAQGRGGVLLGGERDGVLIPGFDLGNSPAEYTAARVGGRTVFFTTTNGTRALVRCVGACRIVFGSFVNLSAIARAVRHDEHLDIVCAGTEGEVSWEDTLLAGALVDCLYSQSAPQINDAAIIARTAWQRLGVPNGADGALAASMRSGRGGQNLLKTGQAADLDLAAQIDRFAVVPQLDLSDWAIRPAVD